MKQQYFTILPTKDKAMGYIDKFGSEKLRYATLDEALIHYDEFKSIQIPEIGIAKVICINGNDLLNVRRGKETFPDYIEMGEINNDENN